MSETEKKQAQAAEKERMQAAKKTAAKESQQNHVGMVYIGPDIPGAKRYTTYNAGLPDALKEKIKEHPFFNSLVVPVDKLAKASAELAKEGSALSILYQRACENKEKER